MIQDNNIDKLSVKTYQSDMLKSYSVMHGFFTRLGGVSSGIYESLNFYGKSGDDPANIAINKQIVASYFNANAADIKILNQIHSNVVTVIDESNINTDFGNIEADSLVTKLPNVLISVITADCVPLLFLDEVNKVIGAAHAGWRSAFLGIVKNTIVEMLKLGAKVDYIKVAIGPAIGWESYEVDDEFKIKFLEQSTFNDIYFKPSSNQNHYLFDLKGYVAGQLKSNDIKYVEDLNLDTYNLEHEFFSCRRSFHKGQSVFGDQISTIYLKDD